jgi:hypothetical protein
MNKAESAVLIATLATAFPNAKFGEENANLYESAISDLGAAECQAAIGELIHSSRFLPTVAEIRGEVMRGRRDRQRISEQASRLKLTSPTGETVGPPAAYWAATLASMLELAARHRRMAEAWYVAHGKRPPSDPGAEFDLIAGDGAAGRDVAKRVREKVIGDFDETERRYP